MQVPEYIKKIPKVDRLYQQISILPQYKNVSRPIIIQTIQTFLEQLREGIIHGQYEESDLVETRVIDNIKDAISKAIVPNLRSVINATGVIVHTNLGRSLLPQSALDQIVQVSSHYSNLEYNLETGQRGKRYTIVESLICALTGAEAATVVNNNAGAVLLTLQTIAKDKAVIVSRGELVEIGGSFRIPDIMALSGAKMVEIGTTNRTHLRDYQNAITSETALLLKVHQSNYAIMGFTAQVELKEMIQLGRTLSIPVMYDMGSGNLADFTMKGLPDEPVVQKIVSLGVDIATFSGDKLLGGPQAGIIVGKKSIINAVKQHPMARALRIDKLTLAALEATLRLYQDPKTVFENIPTLAFISRPLPEIKATAEKILEGFQELTKSHFQVNIIETNSKIGGGALPLHTLPTYCIGIVSQRMSSDEIEQFFRSQNPPVIGRIEDNQYLLDCRTIMADEIPILHQLAEDLGALVRP